MPAKAETPDLCLAVVLTGKGAFVVAGRDPKLLKDGEGGFAQAGSGDSQLFGGGGEGLVDDVRSQVMNEAYKPQGGGVGILWPYKLPEELRHGHCHLPGLAGIRLSAVQFLKHSLRSLASIRNKVCGGKIPLR